MHDYISRKRLNGGSSFCEIEIWRNRMKFRNPKPIIISFLKLIKANNWKFSFYLIIIILLTCLINPLLILIKIYQKIINIKQKLFIDKEIYSLKKRKKEIILQGSKGYIIKIEDLGLSKEGYEKIKGLQKQKKEITIAEIDHDGLLLSHFGPIDDADLTTAENYVKHQTNKLSLIEFNGYVGVKKDFKENKLSFVKEIKALHHLGLNSFNVPAILDIDFDNLTLTTSYIKGDILRMKLIKKGAKLLSRDLISNKDYWNHSNEERDLIRIKEGKKFLFDVVDKNFIKELLSDIIRINSSSLILNDIKYGNIVIEKNSGKPFWIDFESSDYYPHLCNKLMNLINHDDIELFNLQFDTNMLTYKKIKDTLKTETFVNSIYAPVYIGYGLRVGPIWDLEAGFGRWHYILKQNLPDFKGKRILDLGANNGSNAIQLLRSGAKEVIAFELNETFIEQGRFLKSAVEWADGKQYNFHYIKDNMSVLPSMDLGKFDFVMALCSIYYLDDMDIDKLIQHFYSLTDTVVLQCNIEQDIGRQDPETYRKASIDYTTKKLIENGFSNTQVIKPLNYCRPLVIGEKEKKQI